MSGEDLQDLKKKVNQGRDKAMYDGRDINEDEKALWIELWEY